MKLLLHTRRRAHLAVNRTVGQWLRNMKQMKALLSSVMENIQNREEHFLSLSPPAIHFHLCLSVPDRKHHPHIVLKTAANQSRFQQGIQAHAKMKQSDNKCTAKGKCCCCKNSIIQNKILTEVFLAM